MSNNIGITESSSFSYLDEPENSTPPETIYASSSQEEIEDIVQNLVGQGASVDNIASILIGAGANVLFVANALNTETFASETDILFALANAGASPIQIARAGVQMGMYGDQIIGSLTAEPLSLPKEDAEALTDQAFDLGSREGRAAVDGTLRIIQRTNNIESAVDRLNDNDITEPVIQATLIVDKLISKGVSIQDIAYRMDLVGFDANTIAAALHNAGVSNTVIAEAFLNAEIPPSTSDIVEALRSIGVSFSKIEIILSDAGVDSSDLQRAISIVHGNEITASLELPSFEVDSVDDAETEPDATDASEEVVLTPGEQKALNDIEKDLGRGWDVSASNSFLQLEPEERENVFQALSVEDQAALFSELITNDFSEKISDDGLISLFKSVGGEEQQKELFQNLSLPAQGVLFFALLDSNQQDLAQTLYSSLSTDADDGVGGISPQHAMNIQLMPEGGNRILLDLDDTNKDVRMFSYQVPDNAQGPLAGYDEIAISPDGLVYGRMDGGELVKIDGLEFNFISQTFTQSSEGNSTDYNFETEEQRRGPHEISLTAI